MFGHVLVLEIKTKYWYQLLLSHVEYLVGEHVLHVPELAHQPALLLLAGPGPGQGQVSGHTTPVLPGK